MAIEDKEPTNFVLGKKGEGEPKFKNVVETSQFTEVYREKCFTVWYEAGKPRNKEQLLTLFPEDEYGRTPKLGTIIRWRNKKGGWAERGRELDTKVRKEMDSLLISKRIDMFERHAETGATLAEMGLEFLLHEHGGIDSANAAIKAIKEGTDLERKATGISELLKEFATMKDSQIVAKIQELSAADEDEEYIDDEDIIDAEFEEKVVEETE